MFWITICLLIFSGCADIQKPSLGSVLHHPWDTKPSLRKGLSKEYIRSKWGNPDSIIALGYDEVGLPKEEWVYIGRFPDMPFDYKYLSKTKHLYFIGEELTNFESEE